VLDAAGSDTDVLFGEIHVFLQLGSICVFGGNNPISTSKHLSKRQYSFPNIYRFLQGNMILDAAASNIDSFL
jgi:hypothetical protein